MLTQIGFDVVCALRRLRASPTFSLFGVVSLALGLGVTTAIYSVIYGLLWTPVGVRDASHIGIITSADPLTGQISWRGALSRPDLADLAAAHSRIAALAASSTFSQALVANGAAEFVQGEAVTGNYFDVLGVAPHLGRLIQQSDDERAAEVVISFRLWRSKFASDPGIVGRVVRIGGESVQVIGVAAESFDGLISRLQLSTGIWVPLQSAATTVGSLQGDLNDRSWHQLTVVTPLPRNVPVADLSAEVRAIGQALDSTAPIARRTEESAPGSVRRNWAVGTLAAVVDSVSGPIAGVGAAAVALVGLVLVVACTNLANLVIARGSTRRQELAVRRALGASRGRLVCEQLVESLLLALAGAGGALIVARALLVWFSSADVPISTARVIHLEPSLNLPVLALAGFAMFLALLVFGLGPALQLAGSEKRPTLPDQASGTASIRWGSRRRMISWQVAISVTFLVIAVICAKVVVAESTHETGIDVDRLVVGVLNLRLAPWNEARARLVLDRIVGQAHGDSGFDAVALSSGLPFGTMVTPIASVTPVDKPFPPHANYLYAQLLAATPNIFEVLGVPVIRGRALNDRDVASAQPVAVVSERTAVQLFGTTNVVGREFLLRNYLNMADHTTIWRLEIVGIARDTDTELLYRRRAGVVYLPLAQHYEPTLMVVGRTAGDPSTHVGALRAFIARVDPDLLLEGAGSGPSVLTGLYVTLRIVSRLAGGLAILAAFLAMAGLYGVLSHLVAHRTREMGLRMALGADAANLRKMVLWDGLRPVVSGLAMGLTAGLIGRVVARAVFSSPLGVDDVFLFAIVPIPLVFAALVACYGPATRAVRVDPNVALRNL